MIVSKNSDAQSGVNPANRSALGRMSMRNGMRVVVCSRRDGVIGRATVRSSPFTESHKKADKKSGQFVLLRNDDNWLLQDVSVLRAKATNEGPQTFSYSLYDLGVAPDEDGNWNTDQYLLNADKYDNSQPCEDGSDLLDPPER